jgi:hypothetical protein
MQQYERADFCHRWIAALQPQSCHRRTHQQSACAAWVGGRMRFQSGAAQRLHSCRSERILAPRVRGSERSKLFAPGRGPVWGRKLSYWNIR